MLWHWFSDRSVQNKNNGIWLKTKITPTPMREISVISCVFIGTRVFVQYYTKQKIKPQKVSREKETQQSILQDRGARSLIKRAIEVYPFRWSPIGRGPTQRAFKGDVHRVGFRQWHLRAFEYIQRLDLCIKRESAITDKKWDLQNKSYQSHFMFL